jgi:hypothetical protein
VENVGVWEMTTENIKISAKESLDYDKLKKDEPWFDLQTKQTPWPLVQERTIPTEGPSLVDDI